MRQKSIKFFEWFTSKYQLIIRNEENFAEKTTITFNYAKVFLIFSLVFFFFLVITFFFGKYVLTQWYDPEAEARRISRQVVTLTQQIDSLETKIEDKDRFIQSFKTMIEGGEVAPALLNDKKSDEAAEEQPLPQSVKQQRQQSAPMGHSTSHTTPYTVYLSPVDEHERIDQHKPDEQQYGVRLRTKSNEPVKTVSGGTVVVASWSAKTGYVIAVQHDKNIISVYKHNGELLKAVGDYVKSGDVIAFAGKESNGDGSVVDVELWQDGNPLNPNHYITF